MVIEVVPPAPPVAAPPVDFAPPVGAPPVGAPPVAPPVAAPPVPPAPPEPVHPCGWLMYASTGTDPEACAPKKSIVPSLFKSPPRTLWIESVPSTLLDHVVPRF